MGTPSGTVTSDYDGEGRRVRKTSGVEAVYFVYDIFGRVIAEYGGQVAVTGRKFLTTDHLGSTRVVTNASGDVVARHDYFAYGEEYPLINGRTTAMGYQPTIKERKQFTGKERDQESGLDNFLARFYAPILGRFTSVDPIKLKTNRLVNPQRFNLYSYVINNPLSNIDPDGRDAIAVVFPDYKIATPIGRIGGLGHAGVVTIDSKGKARYFEYGRYDDAGKGLVRDRTYSVIMGPDGKPTKESLNKLLGSISQQAGNGGRIEGSYFTADDKQTAQMNKYAEGREEQNSNPSRESYDLMKNNCATFMDKTIEAGGMNLPSDLSARPNGQIDALQSISDLKVEFDPTKNQLNITEIKKKKDGMQ